MNINRHIYILSTAYFREAAAAHVSATCNWIKLCTDCAAQIARNAHPKALAEERFHGLLHKTGASAQVRVTMLPTICKAFAKHRSACKAPFAACTAPQSKPSLRSMKPRITACSWPRPALSLQWSPGGPHRARQRCAAYVPPPKAGPAPCPGSRRNHHGPEAHNKRRTRVFELVSRKQRCGVTFVHACIQP